MKEAFQWNLSDTCRRRKAKTDFSIVNFLQPCLFVAISLTLTGPPRSRTKSMPRWFPQTFVEKVLWNLCNFLSKIILFEGDFLIPHDLEKCRRFFPGRAALTSFNRITKDVNGVPCRYKSVHGVLLESLRRLGRLRHHNGKITTYSQESLTWDTVFNKHNV